MVAGFWVARSGASQVDDERRQQRQAPPPSSDARSQLPQSWPGKHCRHMSWVGHEPSWLTRSRTDCLLCPTRRFIRVLLRVRHSSRERRAESPPRRV